jgi:hypothetical protein
MIARKTYNVSEELLTAGPPGYGVGATSDVDEILALWAHVFGEQRGVVATFSGLRPTAGNGELQVVHSAFFSYPEEERKASEWLQRDAASERETFFCPHLFTAPRRTKDNAAPLSAVYVDSDGGRVKPGTPSPTAVVESSPNRAHLYWALSEPVIPETGERLNRRLALATGGDKAGWDLTQLLRPPGTPNYKYPGAPLVRLLEITEERHDPVDLDRLLPPLPRGLTERPRSRRPKNPVPTPELSRLSPRMQELIRNGNRGGQYPSRSEADMAACVAMFGAGYSEAAVWAVMSDPANGISEKFLEKGRHGEGYLALTVAKAQAIVASTARLGRGKVYDRRKGVVSLG